MVQEIGQPDIQDRQLLATKAKPRVSLSREIGEAVVTHTIFGRAKVRIIRKHDQTRRALWLTALAVTALAAAAWQGWFASRQTEPQQSTEPLPIAKAKMQENVPASQPEAITTLAAPPAAISKPVTPAQAGTGKLATRQQSEPQASPSEKGAGQLAAKLLAPQSKPVTAQPLAASKPSAAPATDPGAVKNAIPKPLPAKPLAPKQASTGAKPLAMQPAVQSAASSPAAVVPLASPIVKEDTTGQPPAAIQQPAEPINPQSK